MSKPKMVNIYIVCEVYHKLPCNGPSGEKFTLVAEWADGQAGVCAAFTNRRKAERYARVKGSHVICTKMLKEER